MKKAGKLIRIALLLATLLLMVGCGYTEEEKALMKEYEDNAKVNAVAYIENKYGFTPKITGTTLLKVDPGPVPDFSPSATGYVNVAMKHNDIEFKVNISGEDINVDGKDDYQKTEILGEFKVWLEKELSISIATIDMQYGNECLLSDTFTDIDSFLDNVPYNTVSISLKTLDDVSEATVKNITASNIQLLILSARNDECIKGLSKIEYLNNHAYKNNFYNAEAMDNKLSEYSFFIKGYVYRSMEGNVYVRQYALKKSEDGVYYTYDKLENAADVSINKTNEMAAAYDWSRDSGKVDTYPTFENPRKVSDSYAVEFGNHSKIQIYIKKDTKKDSAQRYIALQYIDENGKEIFTHIAPYELEGYYTFTLENEADMKIAVMINEKK